MNKNLFIVCMWSQKKKNTIILVISLAYSLLILGLEENRIFEWYKIAEKKSLVASKQQNQKKKVIRYRSPVGSPPAYFSQTKLFRAKIKTIEINGRNYDDMSLHTLRFWENLLFSPPLFLYRDSLNNGHFVFVGLETQEAHLSYYKFGTARIPHM